MLGKTRSWKIINRRQLYAGRRFCVSGSGWVLFGKRKEYRL